MSSPAWVVTCTGCKCILTCFAIDPQLEHVRAESLPPQSSAVVLCPCCDSPYRYSGSDISRGVPRRNPQCGLKTQNGLNGALLVAATVAAAIRLDGAEVKASPKLTATVKDSVSLARLVMAEMTRR